MALGSHHLPIRKVHHMPKQEGNSGKTQFRLTWWTYVAYSMQLLLLFIIPPAINIFQLLTVHFLAYRVHVGAPFQYWYFEVVARIFLPYRYETWAVRVAYGRMLNVFGNTFIRRVVHMRRGDCIPAIEKWHNFVLHARRSVSLDEASLAQASRRRLVTQFAHFVTLPPSNSSKAYA